MQDLAPPLPAQHHLGCTCAHIVHKLAFLCVGCQLLYRRKVAFVVEMAILTQANEANG